jgi:predicted DCC family thiol-disulfide oxidoreductase YuxK
LKKDHEKSIVLFDGRCNFCNASVNFIIKHNRKEDFIFVPLQSPYGKEILERFHLLKNYTESIVLIEGKKVFFKSTAALRISKKLNGMLSLLFVFILVPAFLRDGMYDWIAKHRMSWFKNQDSCIVPDARIKDFFREDIFL